MKTTQAQFNKLSPHLFWDVDSKKLDFNKSKKLIILRVLDYGLIGDWQIILKTYGISEIAKTAISLRELDKKSASFISLLSKIPIDHFLCYTSKRSIPQYTNF